MLLSIQPTERTPLLSGEAVADEKIPANAVGFEYNPKMTIGEVQKKVKEQFASQLAYVDIEIVRQKGCGCLAKRSLTITMLPREPNAKVAPFFKGAWYCLAYVRE